MNDIPYEENEYIIKTIREIQINISSRAEATAEIDEWGLKFQKLHVDLMNLMLSYDGEIHLDIIDMVDDMRQQFMLIKEENYLLKQMLKELAPGFFNPATRQEYVLFVEADGRFLRRKNKKYTLYKALEESFNNHVDIKYFQKILKTGTFYDLYQDYLRWRSKNKKDRANFTS
jgi:uncharacterized protein YfbU (UPF0304 family)